MKKQFLEAGKIVNTHGTRGEVKIEVWADGPEFFNGLKRLYIDGKAYAIESSHPQKGCSVMKLAGINDINAAMPYKNKIVFINRDDVKLEDGAVFLQDIIGMKVVDADTGEEIGTVDDVMELPRGNVYSVKGKTEHLIPAVDEFVIETDTESNIMRVRLIEGM